MAVCAQPRARGVKHGPTGGSHQLQQQGWEHQLVEKNREGTGASVSGSGRVRDTELALMYYVLIAGLEALQ